jgi:hypothetical protein
MYKKNLLAYKINNQVIGIDIQSWTSADLNNNLAFKSIDSSLNIPVDYENISNIENWHNYGYNVENDYLSVKNQIKELYAEKGWVNLTNNEIDLVIQYYCYINPMDPIVYLMGKGYLQDQAQYYVLQQWHKHHKNLLEVCKQRWYYVKFIVAMYLNFSDAEEVLDTTQTLIFSYTECGRLGINYGDKNPGIMDYLESTNNFQNQGLRENNYALNFGTWNILINSMKDILVYGKYNKYE